MNEHKPLTHSAPTFAPKLDSIDASWNVAKTELGKKSFAIRNIAPNTLMASFHLKTPVLLRDDAICDALELNHLSNEVYVKLASCIHHVGGALLATVENLASVPLREMPVMIAPIGGHSMPSVESILSADAIELQLGDWSRSDTDSSVHTSLRSLRVDWPVDAPDLLRLAKKMELIRCLSNYRVPVGVAIPIGDISEAGLACWRWLSEIDIDFVTIRSPFCCLGSRHQARAYFDCDPIELTRLMKELLDRSGKKPIAIVIDHPWTDGFQAGHAILAGASLVGVGSFLASLMPSNFELPSTHSADSLASGLLGRSSIQSSSLATPSVAYFVKKLDLNSSLTLFTEQVQATLEYAL